MDIMNELKLTRISLGIHASAAAAVGWASSLTGGWTAWIIGIAVLIGCGYFSEKITKKKGIKWWFANGIFIYLMFWLVSWTVFINI